MNPLPTTALGAALLGLLLSLVGCGAAQPDSRATLAGYQAEVDAFEQAREQYRALPAPTPGLVRVLSGDAALATALDDDALPGGLEARRATTDDDSALARLCAGDVDVAEVRRPVDDADIATCAESGLGLVQLEVATTADVLAVTARGELSPACVPDDAVETAVADPSTLTSWTQPTTVDGAPLSLAGPAQGSVADRVAWLAGSRSEAVQAELLPRREEQSTALAEQLSTAVRQTQDALGAFRRARSAGDGAATAAAREEFARLRAQREIARRAHESAVVAEQSAVRARDAQASRAGRMALVPWGGYVGQADRLEPLAVSTGSDDSCVVPEPATIADGSYPLTHPVLLTVTTRSWQRSEVAAYLEAFLAEVPGLAAAVAVVPADDALLSEQRDLVRDDTPPTVGPPQPVLPPPPPPPAP